MSISNGPVCQRQTQQSEMTLAHTSQLDAFGRLRVSNPVTLFDSQNRYRINDKYYSSNTNGATITYSAPESTVLLNVVSNSTAIRESRFVFNYQPGKSLMTLNTFVMAPPQANLIQRVGYYGSDNGYYIQRGPGSNVYVVERSNSSGTLTEILVPQSQWNVDRIDGTGPSGVTLNLLASQIWFTDIEWLGVGSVRTGVCIDGRFIPCHVFHHANIKQRTYITTACLPIRYEILASGTISSTATLRQICSTVLSEGGYEPKEQLFCAVGPIGGNILNNTRIPLVSIRLAPGRLDAIAVLKQINLAVSSGNDLAQWYLVLNGTLTGATFTANTESTNIQVDTAASAISGGRNIEVGYAQTGSINTSLQASFFEAQVGRNSFTQTSDIITFCANGLTPDPKVFWSLAWSELV